MENFKNIIKKTIGPKATEFVSENKSNIIKGTAILGISLKSLAGFGADAPKNFDKVEKSPTIESVAKEISSLDHNINTYSQDTTKYGGDFREAAMNYQAWVQAKLDVSSPAFKAEFGELTKLPGVKLALYQLVDQGPDSDPKKEKKRQEKMAELRQKYDDLEAKYTRFTNVQHGSTTNMNPFYSADAFKRTQMDENDENIHVQLGLAIEAMNKALRGDSKRDDTYEYAMKEKQEKEQLLAGLQAEQEDNTGIETAQK